MQARWMGGTAENKPGSRTPVPVLVKVPGPGPGSPSLILCCDGGAGEDGRNARKDSWRWVGTWRWSKGIMVFMFFSSKKRQSRYKKRPCDADTDTSMHL